MKNESNRRRHVVVVNIVCDFALHGYRISIENMCLAMSNKFLLQLCMTALDRSMRSINSSNENNDFDCDILS